MSEYAAIVRWERGEQSFIDDSYSRGHEWIFDGGAVVSASSSPEIVPVPKSVAEGVDPEEAFVASISSCHMLFFLALAAKRKFTVDAYEDNASGILEKTPAGDMAMTRVVLRPNAAYSGDRLPSAAEVETLHNRAHDLCFIANSVTTRIDTEIVN